jgi:hypothetical protein
MPSKSKSQQRLMGIAYAVKKGDMQISDVDSEYREDVKGLVDGMTLKKLKDYAATKHDNLPERVPEGVTTSQIGGMGPVSFPTSSSVGSGDIPVGSGDAEERYKEMHKRMKHLKSFEGFINESMT